MVSEKTQSPLDADLGAIIRRLRRDSSMTQVEFANALGVTPTSIYRYEAGTTSPSTDTLLKLYNFASERVHGTSERAFHQAIQGRSSPMNSTVIQEYGPTPLDSYASRLSHQQRILILGLIRLLSDSSANETAVYTVLRALAAPYLGQAEADLKVADSKEQRSVNTKKPASR